MTDALTSNWDPSPYLGKDRDKLRDIIRERDAEIERLQGLILKQTKLNEKMWKDGYEAANLSAGETYEKQRIEKGAAPLIPCRVHGEESCLRWYQGGHVFGHPTEDDCRRWIETARQLYESEKEITPRCEAHSPGVFSKQCDLRRGHDGSHIATQGRFTDKWKSERASPYTAICQGGSGGPCCDPDCEKCWPEKTSACQHNRMGARCTLRWLHRTVSGIDVYRCTACPETFKFAGSTAENGPGSQK